MEEWKQGFGHKFVGLTDWLLGGIKGSREVGYRVFDGLVTGTPQGDSLGDGQRHRIQQQPKVNSYGLQLPDTIDSTADSAMSV